MSLCLSSVCWISALVHSAAITKCHRQAGLQTTEIYFENSGGWKSKIQDRGRVQSDERALLVHHQALLAVTPNGGKETELSGVSSCRRDWSGAWGLHGRRRITSSMTCFLIPLPWSLGFPGCEFAGERWEVRWLRTKQDLTYPSPYHLSTHHVSVFLSSYFSVIYFSVSPSIHPPFHPSYLSIYLSCLSISYPLILYLPTYYLYSHLPFYLFIHPFFYSTHLSI